MDRHRAPWQAPTSPRHALLVPPVSPAIPSRFGVEDASYQLKESNTIHNSEQQSIFYSSNLITWPLNFFRCQINYWAWLTFEGP